MQPSCVDSLGNKYPKPRYQHLITPAETILQEYRRAMSAGLPAFVHGDAEAALLARERRRAHATLELNKFYSLHIEPVFRYEPGDDSIELKISKTKFGL